MQREKYFINTYLVYKNTFVLNQNDGPVRVMMKMKYSFSILILNDKLFLQK